MTFQYTFTLAISGPNKLPRFRAWAAEHAAEIAVSLPPQVPAKTDTLTIRLKSVADRETLTARLADIRL
ncbi:MAG: hypothetical protein P0Y66_13125 [Candidatus Kaistia colombiensis]|nr:MAG: hypothetical protein P0Y66_13125 [Kaistia sp.]